jgi:hypothetical protein
MKIIFPICRTSAIHSQQLGFSAFLILADVPVAKSTGENSTSLLSKVIVFVIMCGWSYLYPLRGYCIFHTEVRSTRCQIFRRGAVLAINSLGAQKYLRRSACICYFTAAFEGLALEPNKISSQYLALPPRSQNCTRQEESFSPTTHSLSYLCMCWFLLCPSRDSTLLPLTPL